jgi:hypothetical protein
MPQALTGVVQETFRRTLWISANTASSPRVMVVDVQPNATTSSSMLGRTRSTLDAHADDAQRFWCDAGNR